MGSTEPQKPTFQPLIYGPTGPSVPPSAYPPPQSPYAVPPQGYQAYTPPPVQAKTNSLAIAAVVCIFFFPIASGFLGYFALKQIKASNGAEKGEGMAIAGIVVGVIIIIWAFFAIIGSMAKLF